MRNIPVKTIYSLANKPRKVNRLFQGVESSLYQFSVVKSTECKYFGNVKPISRTIRNLSLSSSRKISTFRRETGMLLTEDKKRSWKPLSQLFVKKNGEWSFPLPDEKSRRADTCKSIFISGFSRRVQFAEVGFRYRYPLR